MLFTSYGSLENSTRQLHDLLRSQNKSAGALRTEPRASSSCSSHCNTGNNEGSKFQSCGHKGNSRPVLLLVWARRHVCNSYLQTPTFQTGLFTWKKLDMRKQAQSIHPSTVQVTSSGLWLKVFFFQEKYNSSSLSGVCQKRINSQNWYFF